MTVILNTALNSYCLVATDANGSHAWTYISNSGGLQAGTVVACPGGFAAS